MIRRFSETINLPFENSIPQYSVYFIKQVKVYKRFLKFFRRYVYLLIKLQFPYERLTISKTDNHILWINKSAPSLGDSLMDLSARVLLKGRKIDLLTDEKNFFLYSDDNIFDNVYKDLEKIKNKEYDLIILDSYSSRTISLKVKYFSKVKFVSIYGFFNGPEVNRVLFNFYRLNQLLNYKLDNIEIQSISKPSISLGDISIKTPRNYISISVGGEWGYRTYEYWYEVIKFILKNYKNYRIMMIGSKNAISHAEKLSCILASDRLINCVNKFSFNETAMIIKKSKLFIGCDGGLMHAANCFEKKIVPLFARHPPDLLLTRLDLAYPLFDKDDVNNILPGEINLKIKQALENN